MKIVVIVLLVLFALAAGFFLLVGGVIFFSAIALDLAAPTRETLLDTTANGLRVKFEKLSKQDIGYTRVEYLLSLNGRFVWSSGSELEKNFRVTAHGVIPVHPEDLKNVVSIRRFSPPPVSDTGATNLKDVFDAVALLAVGTGKTLWLSPKEVSETELKQLGDFIESKKRAPVDSPNAALRYLDFPLFVEALVYADEALFAPRTYARKIKSGEETITIHLDGEAHFRREDKNDVTFGQSFGRLDQTTKILFVSLEPLDSVRPLELTAAEIEAFTNQQGEPLGNRYQVRLIERKLPSP